MTKFSKNHPVWTGIIGLVLLVIIVSALAGGSSDKSTTPTTSAADTSAQSTPAQTTPVDPDNPAKADDESDTEEASSEPTPKPPSSKQRVKDALSDVDAGGYVGKVKVQKVVRGGSVGSGGLDIYVTTPEGGLSGASWDDLDKESGAIFQAVYGEAHYRNVVGIIYRGGLVNSETGKELPDVNTGIYRMTGSQAKDIDWSDDDAVKYNIKWDNYREFAHPALKH